MLRTAILLIMVVMPFSLMASGDYVWEEKFQKLLPKAQQGDAEAQYDVGTMYSRGRGVPRDAKVAFEWYVKSAEQGHVKAAYKAGYALLKGQGTDSDPQQAYAWLDKASEKGYERAHFYKAEMYENGLGVDKSLETALVWYEKAAEAGYHPARERVNRVKAAIAESNTRQSRHAELAKMREEAAARKQVAKANVAAQHTASKKAAARKVSMKAAPPTTFEMIMQGGWKKRDKPSEYLPSDITACKPTGKTIECVSKEQQRNVGVADVKYTTKAVVFSIKPSGDFKISYRNRVTDVVITDPEFAESGAKAPVSKGWQDAEHSLACKFEKNDELKCKKDKLRTIKLRR